MWVTPGGNVYANGFFQKLLWQIINNKYIGEQEGVGVSLFRNPFIG